MQSSFVSHVNKVHALEGVIAEHDAIKDEIGVLRELVEKVTTAMSSGDNGDGWNHEEKGEEGFGGPSAEVDDDDSRSIRTIVWHKLERVEEEDEEQMAKQEEEEEEERRMRGVEHGRPRTPEPMSLGDAL